MAFVAWMSPLRFPHSQDLESARSHVLNDSMPLVRIVSEIHRTRSMCCGVVCTGRLELERGGGGGVAESASAHLYGSTYRRWMSGVPAQAAK